MDQKDEARQKIHSYLAINKKRLEMMTVDLIVWEVQTFVAMAKVLEDSEVRAMVSIWRSLNGLTYSIILPPGVTPPPPTSSDGQLIESVKQALKSLVEGVDLRHGNGKINISVTGLTAELQKASSVAKVDVGVGGVTGEVKKDNRAVSAGVSWGGTLAVEAHSGNFYFSGSLSSDRWEIKLSFGEDIAIPNLSTLGKIFGEGERAMGNIIGATSRFRNLNDVSRIKDAISPNIQPVQEAVEAVKGIAKASPNRVSAGFSLGSPDPFPGQTGTPQGVQGQLTLTIRF